LELHPALGWRSARMERAAGLAGARPAVGVEGVVERRQVVHEMLNADLHAVDERAAREAVPFEAVDIVRPRRLDHEPDRARLPPLRRMAHMWRQQGYIALPGRHLVEPH